MSKIIAAALSSQRVRDIEDSESMISRAEALVASETAAAHGAVGANGVGRLARRLGSKMGEDIQREMIAQFPQLLEIGTGIFAEESRRFQSTIDWFVHRFVPMMLGCIGADEYAQVFENLPKINGPASIDRVISVCASMTYLVDGPAEQVFHELVDAFKLLPHDPWVVRKPKSVASVANDRLFGRGLVRAISAAAHIICPSGADDRHDCDNEIVEEMVIEVEQGRFDVVPSLALDSVSD